MIILLSTFVLSGLFCGLYIVFARRWHLVDRPNERSAHEKPTPHGGGLPLLLAFCVGCILAAPWGLDYTWLVIMTVCLMVLGVVDDFRDLSASLRFVLYSLICMSTAAFLFRMSLQSPTLFVLLQVAGLAFALLWALNLYNFMDGIDGLAASQCVLACVGAALLAKSGVDSDNYARFCLLLGVSQMGFLVWNWAPARLFMGDAGSIPTGFLMAGLAAYGSISGELSFATWAVLLAVFITDASYTLAWRLFTGQAFTQAHKLHAYQRLSRHWRSHRRVVLLVMGINVIWLYPIAWATHQWPMNTPYLVILAYIPLLIGVAKIVKLT